MCEAISSCMGSPGTPARNAPWLIGSMPLKSVKKIVTEPQRRGGRESVEASEAFGDWIPVLASSRFVVLSAGGG